MKKIIIEIKIFEDNEIAPIEQQEILFTQLKEKILDGYTSGDIYMQPDNSEEDNVLGYWSVKVI